MEFPEHITLLLKAMQGEQKAAENTPYGMAEWVETDQGVRHGCIPSLHIFNISSEMTMRKAPHRLEVSVSIGGYQIYNLRYADDVVAIAGSMKELQELVDRVRTGSE